MTTQGYSTTFDPGSDAAPSELHTFLSNLASGWTVEAAQTFRSGTSEEYLAWTVHQSGHDLLFIGGVGSNSDWTSIMGFSNSGDIFNESSTGYTNVRDYSDRFLAVGYHPSGGYTTQLYTNGYQPHDTFSPFWDVSREGGGLGSDMWALPWVKDTQSGTTYQWHLIEDDTDPVFSLKYYVSGSLSGGIIDLMHGAIIDNGWPPADESLSPGGLIRISHGQNGAASDPAMAKKDLIVYGNNAANLQDIYVDKQTDFARRVMLDHAAGHFPDVNSNVLTADIPLERSGVWAGHLDRQYMREIPNDGDTYHDVLRPTEAQPLLAAYEKMATMWDNGLTL